MFAWAANSAAPTSAQKATSTSRANYELPRNTVNLTKLDSAQIFNPLLHRLDHLFRRLAGEDVIGALDFNQLLGLIGLRKNFARIADGNDVVLSPMHEQPRRFNFG